MLSSPPTPVERRAALRFPIFRPVQYSVDGREQLGLTQDLSTSGMRLLSACARLPRGGRVELTIPEQALSLDQEPLVAYGHVAWSGDNAAGIAFLDPDGTLAARLQAFLDDYLEHADAREVDVYLRQVRVRQPG